MNRSLFQVGIQAECRDWPPGNHEDACRWSLAMGFLGLGEDVMNTEEMMMATDEADEVISVEFAEAYLTRVDDENNMRKLRRQKVYRYAQEETDAEKRAELLRRMANSGEHGDDEEELGV